MSHMDVNIGRIVREDISSRMNPLHVIFEAITNSIQANSTHVICRFKSLQPILKDEKNEIAERRIDIIEIEDNGDGFNDGNYKSFGDYRSDYKVKLGCKGLGRFAFLKIFENVAYTSWLQAEQEKREFKFSFDFDKDEALKKVPTEVSKNKTILILSGVTREYYFSKKKLDRRLVIDLDAIKEKVLLHLIPTLYFSKTQDKSIKIDLIDTDLNAVISITDNDIPDFTPVDFYVFDWFKKKYDFKLFFYFKKGVGVLKSFYCAHLRTVCEFDDTEFSVTLPQGYTGYLLVQSVYLDEHVDNDRDKFTIYPVKTDEFQPLSWELINNQLRTVISSLVMQHIPDAVNFNKSRLREIQEERPYLIDYVDDKDLDIAGFVDKRQIIEKAKKKFLEAKENLLDNVGKEDYTDEELQEAIQITQNELVSYIQDRVAIIEKLKKLMKNKDKSEKVIHNLFMAKYTKDNYYCMGKNNLWLLDDRFTSYSYAASDKRIKEILNDVKVGAGTKYDGDKPDLALFFSQDPNQKNALKSVVIELKSFKDKNKSDREKFEGIQQLIDYIEAFQEKESIKEIWAFLVTDIDKAFEDRLDKNEFKPLFSTSQSIYYHYYEKLNAFIYVFGVETLIADAEARNKVFMDIIKKKSKLNDFLKE